MSQPVRDPRICIIGAGMSGITAAYTFVKAGFTNLVILEKGSRVGGVWHWNQYPGLRCDVPSLIYQLSFALQSNWSALCATGEEIQRYHEKVVEHYGLTHYIQLHSEVVSAEYNAGTWRVSTADNRSEEYDFLVCATGVLHHPAVPDIPGMDTFAGDVVHTARWDSAVETRGKRIAVLGSGSTGVQVLSALQPEAEEIVHFNRSPQWVLWAPSRLPQPRIYSWLLTRFPVLHRALYAGAMWGSDILADITTRPSWRRRAVQAYARVSLRLGVRDKKLREKLTPDYEPLCKRQVISDTYYRAIQRSNAQLIDTPITHITPTGIHTKGGKEYPLDVIVLATGFQAHHYMRPIVLTGKDGAKLEDVWSQGPKAYQMTAIPQFPNLFTVLGPNSPVGSISLQYSAELTAGYIVHWLRRFREEGVRTVEVTQEATDLFNKGVSAALGPTVWNSGCHSWYIGEDGSVDLWPYTRKIMTDLLTSPNENHFHVEYCGPAAEGIQ